MNDLYNALVSEGFAVSRMVGYSKSRYMMTHPGDTVVFNSNIITENGKVWWGDLNITLEGSRLQKIANKTKIPFYVLREMDARFGTESDPFNVLKEKAVVSYIPQ